MSSEVADPGRTNVRIIGSAVRGLDSWRVVRGLVSWSVVRGLVSWSVGLSWEVDGPYIGYG